jgi:hypothetical protein
MSENDLIAKFHRNAAHGGLHPAKATKIAEAVLALPDATDLTALAQSLTNAFAAEEETIGCC